MSEPWEIMRMALSEAGREDLAGRITAPVTAWGVYGTPAVWRSTLPPGDRALILKARMLASPTAPLTECDDCWRGRADNPVEKPTCPHV